MKYIVQISVSHNYELEIEAATQDEAETEALRQYRVADTVDQWRLPDDPAIVSDVYLPAVRQGV